MVKKTLIFIVILTAWGTLLYGQPLVFSPTTLPDGLYGSVYPSQTLTVTGGTAPYSFSISAGSLPPGISLSGDGTLSGTPTAAGAYAFTVTATDNSPSPGPYSNTQDYTLNIDQAVVTITANNASMTYGGTIPALSVVYSGFVNGDNASGLTTQPTVSTTATSASPAGTYPITASGAVDSNYTFTYQSGTLTVGRASLTVTADNKAMPLGGPLPALTVSYTGFVNGDGPGNLTTQPAATTTATAASPAGSYPITPHGGSSPNYNFSYVNGTLAVAQAVLTITANPASSVYGAPLVPRGSLTVSYSGFVNGDGPGNLTTKPTVNNSAAPGSPVGTYTLIPTGAVDPNYAIQYVNGTYTITAAPLTITAANKTMTYGAAMPALTATYSGFVNGDKASSLTTPAAITTTANSASPAGTYPISVSGAVDPNYTITYNRGTLTISPATLNVTARAQTKKYGTPDPHFTFTASGYQNGDDSAIFTGSLSRTAGENVGVYPINIGTLKAGGSYTIHFTGNNLTITIGAQQITWDQSLIVGCNGTTHVQLNATASSGLPVSYSVSDNTVATVAGNVMTLLKPGSAIVTASQSGNSNYAAAAPVKDTVSYQAASLITQHWNDVIFFDNSSDDYVAWQWYKNDSLIPGATAPYYSETPSLNGEYFVIATNKDSQQVQSCTLSITGGAAIPGGIKAQPNPVSKGGVATVTSNYPAAALQGAVLQIVDLTGRVRQQVTSVQPSMQVTMPSDNGIYIINLLLSNGAKASVNVLVASQ
ncbi:MAG TPA: MBG domain-containing protein [Puia sp.]|jgi:hypothetical protein|nr:MBG domain-containing protein [Puia sp.]